MKVRRIDTREGFEALAPVWQSVATESGQTSPFLSHEWFGCCWGAAGAESRPEVLLVEDSAGPTAMVPLVCRKASLHGLPARVLGMLSDGPEMLVAQPRARPRRHPSHVAAQHVHKAGRRRLKAGDHAQQRALAGAAWAKYADGLARGDPKRRPLQRRRVAFARAMDAEHVP